MMRSSSAVAFIGLIILCLCQVAAAQVVRQWSVGEKSCGPCALVNSLLGSKDDHCLDAMEGGSSIEKTRWFIDQFGSAQSPKYREFRNCYSVEHGTADVDMKQMVNQFRERAERPPVNGIYVARSNHERSRGFIRRVHQNLKRSIESGFHPLLSVRALVAQMEDQDNADDQDDQDDVEAVSLLPDQQDAKRVWNSKGGHWIAIHAVGDVTEDGNGFMMTFSDSLSGRRHSGLVHMERHRPALVPMAFTVDKDGKENWEWVTNRESLALTSPGMPIGTLESKWYERGFIALRYLIYLDKQSQEPEQVSDGS